MPHSFPVLPRLPWILRLLWSLPLLGLMVSLVGCPEGSAAPVGDSACERIGQQCRLPDGPVGVCNDRGDTDCESPPCLACMPQH